MNKILYLVVFDGYRDRYGSKIYLGGIFDSMDKAKDYRLKIENSCDGVEIVPVTINHEHPIKKESGWETMSDVYLGGYAE